MDEKIKEIIKRINELTKEQQIELLSALEKKFSVPLQNPNDFF